MATAVAAPPLAAANLPSRKSSEDDEYVATEPSSDEEIATKQSKRVEAAAAKSTRPAPKRPPGAVTLRSLIEDGFLAPGEGNMCVEYKGSITFGDLCADGKIRYKGMTFESPSAFSIYLKRLVNPGRKADDGWKTVKYGGHFLEKYKMAYVMKTLPPTAIEPSEEPAAKRAKTAAAAAAAKAEPKEPVRSANGKPQLAQLAPRTSTPSLPATAAPASPPAAAAPAPEEDMQLATSPSAKSGPGYYSDEDQSSCDVLSSGLYPQRPLIIKAPCRCGQRGGAEPVPCHAYSGLPGFPTGQPFRLKVAPLAQVMMEFHSHLSGGEVSGYLAGSWDPVAKVLTVERAFPVKDTPFGPCGQAPDVNAVQADHRHQQNVIEFVYFKQVVGWYHSHAGGATSPTSLDLHHHAEAQAAQAAASGVPFVAALLTPYNPAHACSSTATHWFHSAQRAPGGGPVAMQLVADVSSQVEAREAQLHELQEQLMRAQVLKYANHEQRTPMGQVWRDGLTHLDKLTATLATSLPDACFPAQHKACYVARLRDTILASFCGDSDTAMADAAASALAGDDPYLQPPGAYRTLYEEYDDLVV